MSFTGDDSSFIDDDFDDTFDEAFDDDDPINSGYPDDDVSLSASEHSRSYPVSCKVLYGYEVNYFYNEHEKFVSNQCHHFSMDL